jgi:hypothetical protein
MPEKPVQLGAEQSRKVADLARRLGASPERLVNQAVDEFYDKQVPGKPEDGATRLTLEAWRQRVQRHLADLPRTEATEVDVSRASIY